MAKAKAVEAMRRQKEARQKKMLIALAPVLLGLLAWQGPGTVKALTGGNAPPPPAAASEPSTTAETGDLDPANGPAPSTAAPGAPVADPAAPAGVLPDTTDLAEPGPDQLVSFDRFVGRDPFRGLPAEEPEPSSGGGQTDGKPTPFVPPPAGGGDGGDPEPATYTQAVIDVNGAQLTVQKGGTFPSSDPIFRLASVTQGSIKIGLVTGEFTEGQKTIAVDVGESVTLVSEPDGQQYVIRLVAVG